MLAANDKTVARFYSAPSYVPDWGRAELREMLRCFVTKRIVRGQETVQLCEAVCHELGVPYALPFNRARWAIQAALVSMGIGTEDEVVVPSYVCDTVLQPIFNLGARPVFADTGPALHLSVATVERAITSRTKAVIVAHLYGNVAPVAAIDDLLAGSGVALLDDAAQSYGAQCGERPVGTFGACGVVGCGPGKSLAGPAGGLVITRDPKLYERMIASDLRQYESAATVARRVLAFWAWFRFRRLTLGFKPISDALLGISKSADTDPRAMSNLDAALALHQLSTWGRNARRRRALGKEIVSRLGDSGRYCVSDFSSAAIALRVVLILPPSGPGASEVVGFLHRAGIEARRGYEPLHKISTLAADGVGLPGVDALANRIVLLPVASSLLERRPRRALEELGVWIAGGSEERD